MPVSLIVMLVATSALSAGPVPHPRESVAVQAPISDAQILGTLGAADANELEAAKLASTKATSKAVHDYASMLVRDHTQLQTMGLDLAKQLHITILLPPDTMMEVVHKQEMDQLNALSPSAFDKAFVQLMVADHKMVIAKVKTTLLPAARRPQLRAFMRRLQPTLVMHETKGQQWLDSHP